MSDHDLSSILHGTAVEVPAPQHSAQETLASGRRSVARRRYSLAGAAMLGVATLGVVSLNLPFGEDAVVVSAIDPAAAAGDSPTGGAGKPAPQKVSELNPDADAINAKILQAAMGPDFDVAGGDGSLRPGSASAKGLPTELAVGVNMSAVNATDNGMPQMCEAFEEKGSTFDGCTPFKLTDGQIVQANFSRWGPTAQYPQKYAGEAVRVLFRQANGVLVSVDLTTSTTSELSKENADAARTWLKSMVERMGAAATNPNVESQGFLQADDDPGVIEQPSSDEDAAAAKKAALAKQQADDEKSAVAEKQAAAKAAAAKEGTGPQDS